MHFYDTELDILKIQDVNKITQTTEGTHRRSRPTDCFLYVLSGFAYYTFHNKTTKIEKGNVVFFSRVNEYSATFPSDNFKAIYVDFFFENTVTPLQNEVFTSLNASSLENSFEKLNKLWISGNFSDKIYCKSLLYRIYSELARQTQNKYMPTERKERIERAVELMVENFSDAGFSVEQLGPFCHMSPVYFRNIFSQVYHTTPIAFLVSLRINKAKELLRSGHLSVAEIATLCGFNSTYYFSKKFREETGLTPTEFRKIY